MPFKKNDERTKAWGEKGNKAKEDKKLAIWEFLASGGPQEYLSMLERLKVEELAPNEREWMDRVERLFPFVKSKAMQSHDITSGGKVISGFQIIDAVTNPSDNGKSINSPASETVRTEGEN